MSWPTLAVECAFGSDASNASPSWQDITDYVREVRIRRGRQFELDRIDASTLSLKLDNSDRRFDPTYVSGPYYPNVLPMRRVRVRAAAFGPGSALTASGNEVTDATRAAAALLTTSASGQMCDGLSADSSFGIRRAATNLFRRGQCDSANDYAAATGAELRAVDATTPPPFSPQSVKVTTNSAVASQGVTLVTATGQAAAAGTLGVGSVRFKGVGGQSYTAKLRWNHTDATTVTGAVTNFVATGGWQYLEPAGVAVDVAKTGDALLLLVQVNGTRTESFWIAHGMLEKAQSVVAPYVATSGGVTATHAVGRVQVPASVTDEAVGWIAVRVRMGWGNAAGPGGGSGFPTLIDWRDDANNKISIYYGEASKQWFVESRSAATSNTRASAVQTFAAGDALTIIAYWTATTLALSINGVTFLTGARAAGVIPTLAATLFDIGGTGASGSSFNGDVLWFACGTGTLTDADAAAIHANLTTTPRPNGVNANGDASLLTLPTAAAATMVWYADTAIPTVPTTYDLFNGFVERWPPSFDRPQQQFVNVTATDGFAALAQAIVSGSFPQEFSGARISRVLTAASWIASVAATGYWTLGTSLLGTTARLSYGIPTTVLDTGRTEVPAVTFADTDEQTALAHIQDVADSELGVFFIDGAGRAIFHDRNHRTRTTTSSVVFTDGTTSTSRLTYADISPSFDGDRIANDIRVTRSGGVTQPATDPMSITKYLRRTLSRTPLLTSDVEAANQAGYLLRSLKDPYLRFDSITVEPMLTDDAWPHALGREISDRVTVELTPPMVPGGTIETISKDCFVEAIEHRLEPPLTWQTTYQLSPADTASFWTLGSSQLGASTVLAY